MEKITKRERFAQLLAMKEVSENAEMVTFINHEIELLDKKNLSRKSELTETQKENLDYKEKILELLSASTDGKSTSQIAKEFSLSTQRVTPILQKLLKENSVTVETVKRVNYYKVA